MNAARTRTAPQTKAPPEEAPDCELNRNFPAGIDPLQ